eukprot:TRINITY_DN64999_c0_g1_i1.p1 TRINITY_DN64999_c0_g1~~TRINITY_DN64999_c0_g1_i1.p1  ORF type:complete len:489 (+),score=206.94 TRINITY_DN64999_c0_g1_i1:75-1541(+)
MAGAARRLGALAAQLRHDEGPIAARAANALDPVPLSTQTVGRDKVARLKIVYDLAAQFDLSIAKLNQIIVHFIDDMWQGLESQSKSAFKMLPSYVYRGDNNVSGNFMALDLGGTNFRVIEMHLEQGKVRSTQQMKFQIPPELMKPQATADQLFDFVAASITKFLKETRSPVAPLGFTFSFPVNQTAIASGTLIAWTKGFSTAGCEGQDVVVLLQQALKRAQLDIHVAALVNDTVGTLVAGYFQDSKAEVGVILGTGSNACYWEKVSNITKTPSPPGWNGKDEMCVNIEWGNFDSGRREVLPYTQFDDEIDATSPNHGAQRYEKMMSGMYLGEIGRCVLLYLVRFGVIGPIPAVMGPGSLSSLALSQMLGDTSAGLTLVRKLLYDAYQYSATFEEAAIVKQMFNLIAMRSARLAAAGIAAVLIKQGKTHGATVCVDGSVYEKTPGYKEELAQCLDSIMRHHGHTNHSTKVVLTGGGSGAGAAMIAALAK